MSFLYKKCYFKYTNNVAYKGVFMKKLKIILILLFLAYPSLVLGYSDYVVAGGENIGISLKTKGILVVDKYDNTNNFLRSGDIIVSISKNENINMDYLTDTIKNIKNNSIEIGYIRNGKLNSTYLNIKNGKTGLYLKDTISGIGTLTFIDPNTNVYGALGHEIVDSNSGIILESNGGNIYDSKVIDINKSSIGSPGEKNASINKQDVKGDIDTNTNKGLFGNYQDVFNKDNLYEVGDIEDVKIGKAYILTELDDNKVNKYEIEIIDINKNTDIKNIIFKVKDNKLLELGGIVQGMSGSPIIQDNKIIGAVTHVVVDNPTKGYGVFIVNMLKEADKKDLN